MANSNFVVQNGLTVGPLTIDAATGSITTSGTVNITGGLAVSSINKNDSAITINDTGSSGSNISIAIDGVIEHTVSATGVNLASGTTYAINGANVLTSTGLGSGVLASSLTSVGTLTGLTASGVVQITNATNNSGTNYTTGALQVTGGAGFGGDVYVQGNIYAGNLISTTTQILEVTDPLLYLNATNPGTYNYEIGTYSHFGSGATYQHTGLVRDHNDNVWKLFSNVAEPAGGTVNFTSAIYDTFKAGAVILANTTASSSTTTGALQVAGGAGIAGAVYAGSVNTGSGAITTTGTVSATTLTGTLSTAAQTNITSVGTLTGLTVSGAVAPNTNNTINLGGASNYWATVYGTSFVGTSTTAKYADLAENYQADSNYAYGTVVMFGGSAEVTVADAETTAVAGVVSQHPAHLMNGGLTGNNVVPLALQGRVPCNVIGPVKKGDMMVSAGFGYAKASANPQVGQVIGKALNDFTGAKGQIEVVVGRV